MLQRRTAQRIPIIADKWIKLDSSIELYNYCDNPYYLFSPQHSLSVRDGDNYILATVCCDKKDTEWQCNVAPLRAAVIPYFPPSGEKNDIKGDGCNLQRPGPDQHNGDCYDYLCLSFYAQLQYHACRKDLQRGKFIISYSVT